MKLTPINNDDTITFINTSTFTKTIIKPPKPRVVSDSKGLIPNGIYGVIRWERIRQIVTMILSGVLLTTIAILIALGTIVWDFGPLTYITTTIVGLMTLYRFSISTVEFFNLKKSVTRYRQDIQIGLTSTPPFISKMYIGMHKKQIAHNWITFSLLFYGGISTLILWWLKDTSWWILEFDVWIKNWMGNPSLIATLMSITLLIIAVTHIVFAIQRRKRINDMNLYFGQELAPESQIEEIKSIRNKAYRRMFVISLIIIFIIPMIILLILKLIRRRKR